MLKKIGAASLLGFATVSCFAGQFYLGPSIIVQNTSTSHSDYRGISPRFSLGYGSLIDHNIFLAGEFNAIFGSTEVGNSNTSNSLRTSYSYSLSMLPGLFVNDATKAFMRFGAVATRFADQNRVGMGGQLGLGLQTTIHGRWDIRCEYSYTAYQSIHDLHSPTADTFAIGVIRSFG